VTRLLCDENIVGLEAVEPYCELTTVSGRSIERGQLEGVDALWVRSVTKVGKSLLDGTAVKLVGTATAGIEHIDRDYLASHGIAFHAAPGPTQMLWSSMCSLRW
jgi:erythronate-4-phosphate dehydrogenase